MRPSTVYHSQGHGIKVRIRDRKVEAELVFAEKSLKWKAASEKKNLSHQWYSVPPEHDVKKLNKENFIAHEKKNTKQMPSFLHQPHCHASWQAA